MTVGPPAWAAQPGAGGSRHQSASAGGNRDKVAGNLRRATRGGREAGRPVSATGPIPASGRHHPPDPRWAGTRRSAGGYRHHACHVCGCQRCGRDCCCAFHRGGPGAGGARAGGLRRSGHRCDSRHVASPPVPAAGQPGGRRGIGRRRADRDRSARGRGASAVLWRPAPANGRGLPARRWWAPRFSPLPWPARSPPRRGSAVRGGGPPGPHCGWPPLRGWSPARPRRWKWSWRSPPG